MRERVGLTVLVMFLLLGAALVYANARHPGGAQATAVSAPQVEISLLYSSEKEQWLRDAVAGFQTAHPELRVRLESMGSLEAAHALVAGDKKPTLWSPADSTAVELFAQEWSSTQQGPAMVREADRWPRSLLLTPLVFAVWESRARVLLRDHQDLAWPRLREAVAAREGWSGLGGDPAWAFVKFGHADPLRSNSGLQTLVLAAYGFYGRTEGIGIPEVTATGFQDFVRDLALARQRQDYAQNSTGNFLRNVIRQGPSLYDVTVVYESTAIAELPRAQGRWEPLRVVYPEVNLYSDHPLCLLSRPDITQAQKSAAELLADYLLSPPVQRAAVRQGFRPGNLDVPVVENDPENPFQRYRSLGIRVELPRVARVPDGAVLQALLQTWQRNLR